MIKVCIRADGGKNVGQGHIMRCLSLAQAFRRHGHKVHFFSKLDKGIKIIESENFEVVRLTSYEQETEGYDYGSPDQLADEAREMIPLLEKYQIDVLIMDTYNINKDYFLTLKPYVGRTVYIDDINKFIYPVDIVVNGNITGEYLGYEKYDHGQILLLGPQYNMIRNEFGNLPCRFVRSKVDEIMITTGGADPFNLTGSLLVNLLMEEEFRDIRFNVLVGSSFANCESLDDLSNKYNNVFLYANTDLPYQFSNITYSNISSIMLRSDLAISAGGSTLYELAACGTPALAVILADNQEGIVCKMDELGYVMNLGWYNQLKKDLVLHKLDELRYDFQLRREMSSRGQRLVDGKGTERIVGSIIQSLDNDY
ncbi:pseudaminic acid biosynthesis-associated protein PseG [Desulfosporosinus orientis DSM 765]|uniref:Pseudaminic acid biosynthesis-associated protein PseG n=1 Tax=Desulfosporosinus orientis (strain ATCC 19365 / DSM 765 / NCIMB 8382 / VKM B-1628 / Singapore I) TaxID=768706 RepID=G7WI07_DESOD|nr:UDP-2,4-diacetamido-2,4,6-trideoxy-beta-L-altropyranose hydrolase [Desulfosporosinus orientis]AET70304.1 pseudaminic acid biosynthesis-associated protein PseG [Desulfosporosinus orientis DSM 765]